jgi:hypothetical protein
MLSNIPAVWSQLGVTEPSTQPRLAAWARVDRSIDEARKLLWNASTEEQFQSIGLLCREVLISLAQAVFDPDRHPPLDGVGPSSTDAKRMLEAFIAGELSGGSLEELRAYAKAAVRLADALQHRRTATLRDALACAEATTSVVNLIGFASGRPDATGTALAHRAGRDSAEKEYVVLLLSYAIDRHPVMEMADIKLRNFAISDTQVSIQVERQGVSGEAAVERAFWWKPATRATAENLADELLMRALTALPPIQNFKL